MRSSTKTQRGLQALARWIVTGSVILAPWLFGSADPWAYLLICGLVGLGVVAWLFSCFTVPRLLFRWPGLSAVLLLLGVYVLLQLVPLPTKVVAAVNPHSADVTREARDIISEIDVQRFVSDEREGVRVVSSLSLAQGATQRAFYLYLAYLGAFFVMLNSFRHWHQLRNAAAAIVAAGFLMTVLALIHKFSGSEEIFWFHVPRYGGNVFGPFTNRNHFAAHANMLFGIAFGLFLSSRHFRDMIVTRKWSERLAWLSTRRASSMALSAFAVAVLAGGTCVSMSRGGMLGLASALGVFGAVVAFRHESVPRARSGILAVALLVIGSAIWLGGQEMIDRIRSLGEIVKNPMVDYRTIVTLETLDVFKSCPLVGVGFGAFRYVFTAFQSPSLQYRWLHAHNDWAQLLAEGGLAGTALFVTALFLWTRSVRREYPSARHRAKLFVIGVLVGLGTIGVHSFFDYSLHKPANALLLAVMAGMAGAGVCLKPQQRNHIELANAARSLGSTENQAWSGKRLHVVRVIVLIVVVGITCVLLAQSREFRAELAYSRFLYLQRLSEVANDPAGLKKTVLGAFDEADVVMKWGRNNPDELTEISGFLILWEFNYGLDRDIRVTAAEMASESAALAAARVPSDYIPWLALARSQTTMGRWDEAELCLQRSRALTLHPDEVRMFNVAPMNEDLQIP